MSFSRKVKEELSFQASSARHCILAEIAAIFSLCGKVSKNEYRIHGLEIHTENLAVARKCFTLLEKTFNIKTEILIRRNKQGKNGTIYVLFVKNYDTVKKIIQSIKLSDYLTKKKHNQMHIDNLVVQNTCCKRAFIRGAFLAAGSLSNPEKTYHYEIVMPEEDRAKQLQEIINSFFIDSKIVLRKKYYVVYVKEGSQIVELLNIMEAHEALMEFENVRILKEVRNSVNRQVNCEAANINKTVQASAKQIDDIIYIRDNLGFDNLSEGLEEIAELRISYPEASLLELGKMLNPSIGKSGVNHRLKKLSSIADGLLEAKGGNK